MKLLSTNGNPSPETHLLGMATAQVTMGRDPRVAQVLEKGEPQMMRGPIRTMMICMLTLRLASHKSMG